MRQNKWPIFKEVYNCGNAPKVKPPCLIANQYRLRIVRKTIYDNINRHTEN